jgi:hypothetical protein
MLIGSQWLQQFLGLCARCTIDFIPVHIYSTVNNLDHFQNHIQDIRNITAKPIWVTEVCPICILHYDIY